MAPTVLVSANAIVHLAVNRREFELGVFQSHHLCLALSEVSVPIHAECLRETRLEEKLNSYLMSFYEVMQTTAAE